MSVDDSTAPEVTKKVVVSALKDMQGKGPRQDGILVDVLRDAGTEAHTNLPHLL